MYPAQFFSLFPPFSHDDSVFVAMSFHSSMEQRWKQVIEPAIKEVGLKPFRVDNRIVSDSILTDILRGIGRARLIFADISKVDGVRNGNVMYEVGIAHAARLAEEVVLFRDDEDNLLFDLSNIRVNTYSPEVDPQKSCEKVVDSLIAADREVDLQKSLTVQRVLDVLDGGTYKILATTSIKKRLEHPQIRTMGEALGLSDVLVSIRRLLELGLISTEFREITQSDLKSDASLGEAICYRLTSLGEQVLLAAGKKMGFEKFREQFAMKAKANQSLIDRKS